MSFFTVNHRANSRHSARCDHQANSANHTLNRLDSVSQHSGYHPSPRLSLDKHFPTRKRIIFTNFASGGALRNIPKQGDGLGNMVGRLLTRNVLTDAVGASAGLVVFGSLYGLGLALAAINVRKTAQRRIDNNVEFKKFLLDSFQQENASQSIESAIKPAMDVIDESILTHERQKKEAYGLWFSTAGSMIGPIGRVIEAAGSGSVLPLSTLTGGLIGFGLAGFGVVLLANDLSKLKEISLTNQTINHNLMHCDKTQSQVESDFEAQYQRFFKNYEKLLKFSCVNSAILTASASVFPCASIVSLGAATPVLGAITGAAGFLRFTVFEPRFEKNAFKPMTVNWINLYDSKNGPSKAHTFEKLTQIKSTISKTKTQLKNYLSLRNKGILKATKMMDVFPFLKGVHNKTYESLIGKALNKTKTPEKILEQMHLHLGLTHEVLDQINALQDMNKCALEQRLTMIENSPNDPYGSRASEVRFRIRELEKEQFEFFHLKQSALELSKTVNRFSSEGYIESRIPMLNDQMNDLKKTFVTLLGPDTIKNHTMNPKKINQNFLKTTNHVYDIVKALRVNLFHLKAAEDRDAKATSTEQAATVREF